MTSSPGNTLATLFAHRMAEFAPFESSPRLAVAVSGGADSLALALLARDWARMLDGSLIALVVDHGLRAASSGEANQAVARLAAQNIKARLLTLSDIKPGNALAARARASRYHALQIACARAGVLHLLLGHHAADQAETVLIRDLAGSGPQGLAGMAALLEISSARLLRPLLGVPPGSLRDLLQAAGMGWTEDPSNADQTVRRPRLRALRRDPAGTGAATRALVNGAAVFAAARASQDRRIGDILAERARLYPEGFAVLSPGPLPSAALAAVLRAIGGASFPPAPAAVTRLAAALRPATLAGVRLLQAGHLGPGWLVVREAAALAPPIEARPGAIWDGRFRLADWADIEPGTTLGALGRDAVTMRTRSSVPAAVLATLPALRRAGALVAVPHVCYLANSACGSPPLVFAPARAAAPAPFMGISRPRRACQEIRLRSGELPSFAGDSAG